MSKRSCFFDVVAALRRNQRKTAQQLSLKNSITHQFSSMRLAEGLGKPRYKTGICSKCSAKNARAKHIITREKMEGILESNKHSIHRRLPTRSASSWTSCSFVYSVWTLYHLSTKVSLKTRTETLAHRGRLAEDPAPPPDT